MSCYRKTCADYGTYTRTVLSRVGNMFVNKSYKYPYSSEPIKGSRVATEDKDGLTCFKYSPCKVGDLISTDGYCYPKEDTDGVWGWNVAHDFSTYHMNNVKNDTNARMGMVTAASAPISGGYTNPSIRYVELADAGYYHFYNPTLFWSTSDSKDTCLNDECREAFSSYENMINYVESYLSSLQSQGKRNYPKTYYAYRGASENANLWTSKDAEYILANLDDYENMGGVVHNETVNLVRNIYGINGCKNGTYPASDCDTTIYAKQCYYINPTKYYSDPVELTGLSDLDADVRRIVMDPEARGVVSTSNYNNPRYLYGAHLYATGGTGANAQKALYRSFTGQDSYSCSSLYNNGGEIYELHGMNSTGGFSRNQKWNSSSDDVTGPHMALHFVNYTNDYYESECGVNLSGNLYESNNAGVDVASSSKFHCRSRIYYKKEYPNSCATLNYCECRWKRSDARNVFQWWVPSSDSYDADSSWDYNLYDNYTNSGAQGCFAKQALDVEYTNAIQTDEAVQNAGSGDDNWLQQGNFIE